MKLNNLKQLFLITSIAGLMVLPTPVQAQYIAPPQPQQEMVLNKLVQNPDNSQFEKSIPANEHGFLPGAEVTFRIDVTDNGQTPLSNVQVSDKLPDQVDWVSGPGNFDQSSDTLNITIDHLNVGETKSYTFKTKIKNDTMASCYTNIAKAQVQDMARQSNATFCVVTKVLPQAQELPKTGPKETALVMTGTLWTLFMSIYLFKKQTA